VLWYPGELADAVNEILGLVFVATELTVKVLFKLLDNVPPVKGK
jgi:hypothetical protein